MGKNERFFDLAFEKTPDGTVRLTQTDCGVDYVIEAHPEQLKFIVRRLCGLDEAAAAKVADLERRLSILAREIDFIAEDSGFRREIVDSGMDSAFELLARLDGLSTLAAEFDGGRLLPLLARKTDEPQPKTTVTASVRTPITESVAPAQRDLLGTI